MARCGAEGEGRWGIRAAVRLLVMAALGICLWAGRGTAAALDAEAISHRNRDAVVITLGERADTGARVQGSGCCIHEAGIVLTTAHQVKGLDNLRIRLADGAEHPARIIATDDALDFALLHTDAPLSRAVEIGNASELRMGSPLLTIASPRGLEFSAVNGIVSSMNRLYRGHPVIQTDIPASPGSSGGPVFDERGLLIGILGRRIEGVQGATIVSPINAAYALLREHDIRLPRPRQAGEAGDEIIPARDITLSDRAAIRSYNKGVRAETATEKIAAYSDAVRTLPNFFEAWFNLGVAQTAAANGPDAIEAYSRARALHPDSVAAHRNLGRLHLHYENADEAAQAFALAIRANPTDASCHNDLGEAYRQMANYKDAEIEFREALRLKPDYAAPQFNLGLTYAENGRSEEAIAAFETYLKLSPSASDVAGVRAWISKLRGTQ